MKKFKERRYFTFGIFIVITFLGIFYVRSFQKKLKNLNMVQKLKKPNFVFFLTDDQDSWLDSLHYMKNVNELLIKDGLSFENSLVASPLCCPSRSSILTGQYVHNHKAVNNSISGGCNNLYWRNGPEKNTFVKHLYANGYNNFFAGKYLNQYGNANGGGSLKHIPAGWNWWIGLEGNSKYYNYNLSVNGSLHEHANDSNKDYLTSVIKNYAMTFIDQLVKPLSQPFFLMLSTPACHAPFTPEPKYKGNFSNENIPRTPNFNIANDKSKHWLMRLGKQPLSNETVNKIDEIYRQRLRTLQTVDDLVAEVYYALKKKDLLDNTYVIFSSDNGYHLGQFSLPFDKREPYEFDIRVPFVIKGPNVRKGKSAFPIINIDIAPTILDLAGINIPTYMDGASLKYEILDSSIFKSLAKTVLIEHTGESKPLNPGCYAGPGLYGCKLDFECKCSDSVNNTYDCLRYLSLEENYSYCAWADSEQFEELYDLNVDSNQLNNIIESLNPSALKKLRNYLKKYKSCKGGQCRKLSREVSL